MNSFLASCHSPVLFSRDALVDLDLIRLCRTFLPQGEQSDEEITSFLMLYVSYDIDEIMRRNKIIHALCELPNPPASTIKSIIQARKQMCASLSHAKRFSRPLQYYTHMRNALNAYVESIEHMEFLFAAHNDPVMQGISAVISQQKNSSFYMSVQNCLHSIEKLLSPLESVTLGVNMTESGQANQISVMDINQSDEKTVGLFGNNRTRINSLSDDMPVKVRNTLVHLEEYIISQVEKQMARQLGAALKELKKININHLWEWAAQLEPMTLYYAGICCALALRKAGCILCIPQCNDHSLLARDIVYPHMVLSSSQPVPQSIQLSLEDTVMITGANSSGKTSCLKMLAQNYIFAQLGFLVPAQSFAFAPFRQIITVFSAGEDDQLLTSRYQQEAAMIHEAVIAADAQSLVLLNEPFTSTNPVEAAKLLCDIMIQFRDKHSTQIFVTHIYDVYDLLCDAGIPIRSYVTDSILDAEGLHFTYQLQEKAPDGTSYARLLAKEHGLDVHSLISDHATAQLFETYLAGGAPHAPIV